MAEYRLNNASIDFGIDMEHGAMECLQFEFVFNVEDEEDNPMKREAVRLTVMRFSYSQAVAAALRDLADKIEQIGVGDG